MSVSGLLDISRAALPRIKVTDIRWNNCLVATRSSIPWWRATAAPILLTGYNISVFAKKITSVSHQPPAECANAQFDKTQFFFETLCIYIY